MFTHFFNFFSEWLNEDWDLQYVDWQDAFEDYIRDRPERRESIINEFDLFLRAQPQDGLMNDILRARHAPVWPTTVSASYDSWVQDARRIAVALADASSFRDFALLVTNSEALVRQGVMRDWKTSVASFVHARPTDRGAIVRELNELSQNPSSDALLSKRVLSLTGVRDLTEAFSELRTEIEHPSSSLSG